MRHYNPGGRFDADFETDSVLEGVSADLQNPAGTTALWWVFDPVATRVHPVYDVGADTGGRMWKGPYEIPVIKAVIDQGGVPLDERGYYNADSLHLTLDSEAIDRIVPGVLRNPDLQNRGRIIWLGEVFRPVGVQQAGIVANRFSLVLVDCIQVMPEEMINDPQFQQYAVTSYDSATAVVRTPYDISESYPGSTDPASPNYNHQ